MKLIKMLCFVLFVFSLSVKCAMSQSDDGKIPSVVKSAFESKYPNAKDLEWEIDSNGYFEAQFEENDEKYRADFEKSGKWIETEASIKYKHLPKAVQDAVEREYDKDDVKEVEQVDHHQKGIFYDVEIDEKGKKRFDVEYNALGEVIGRE